MWYMYVLCFSTWYVWLILEKKNCYKERLPVAVALKFTVHVVQSFMKNLE